MSDFSINVALNTIKEENKKSEKAPDVTGSLEVPAEEVNLFIAHLQTAERVLNWESKEVIKLRFAFKLGDNAKVSSAITSRKHQAWIQENA